MLLDYSKMSDRQMERLINIRFPDPDQSAAPEGGVCLWDPTHACFDVLEPVPGEVTKTGKQKYCRLYSYVYDRKRRCTLKELR